MSSYPMSIGFYLRLVFFLLLAMLLALLLTKPAWAITVRGDETITIAENEVIDDDLVVTGNTVIVNGVVNGDLVATGSQVIVNGEVKGSLAFAGQTLVLDGKVGGAVYAGGASLTVGPNAEIARNLIFGGYAYRAESGSTIGRDNIIGGYQAVLNGEVARNLYASVAALQLDGRIGGDVEAVVGQPGTAANMQFVTFTTGQPFPPAIPPGIRVGPDAKIGGILHYTSPVDQTGTIAAEPERGIVYSAAVVTPPASGPGTVSQVPANELLAWIWTRVRHFVSLFLIGALALWLIPSIFNQIGERTQTETLLAGAWGLLVTVVGYGGATLLTILLISAVIGLATLTLGGLATALFSLGSSGLGFAVTIFSLLIAYGSKLVVLYPLSHRLLEKYLPQWTTHSLVPLALGILLFVLVRSIPWVGMLVSFGVTLVGLGATWLTFRDRITKTKAATPRLALTPA